MESTEYSTGTSWTNMLMFCFALPDTCESGRHWHAAWIENILLTGSMTFKAVEFDAHNRLSKDKKYIYISDMIKLLRCYTQSTAFFKWKKKWQKIMRECVMSSSKCRRQSRREMTVVPFPWCPFPARLNDSRVLFFIWLCLHFLSNLNQGLETNTKPQL